ncbi:hypothetical protein ES703_122387 [subsurface metagenome]
MEGRAVTLEILGTNETEIAYIAGFFDGEGCVRIAPKTSKATGAYGLYVSASNFYPNPLYLCQRIFGGKIRYNKSPGNRNGIHRWELYGKRAELFLRVVEPQLIIKKQEANLAISSRSLTGTSSPLKEKLAQQIASLKSRNQLINPDEQNGNQR